MTRTGRFLRGLGVGYASQVLTTLVGLWLTTFLLAQLGQSDYGLWLVATQVLSYLLLLDLRVLYASRATGGKGDLSGQQGDDAESKFLFSGC